MTVKNRFHKLCNGHYFLLILLTGGEKKVAKMMYDQNWLIKRWVIIWWADFIQTETNFEWMSISALYKNTKIRGEQCKVSFFFCVTHSEMV